MFKVCNVHDSHLTAMIRVKYQKWTKIIWHISTVFFVFFYQFCAQYYNVYLNKKDLIDENSIDISHMDQAHIVSCNYAMIGSWWRTNLNSSGILYKNWLDLRSSFECSQELFQKQLRLGEHKIRLWIWSDQSLHILKKISNLVIVKDLIMKKNR